MVTVAVSGYFDPLHVGHLEYIKLAKKLGDYLIVIVNNDHQATLKKGKPFMSQEERIKILSALRDVDEVFLSVDVDRSVCKSLAIVKPDIFANGGDVKNEDCLEFETCNRLRIKMIDNLGDKIQSSRNFYNRNI